MRTLSLVAAIATLMFTQLACNPDCQSIQGVSVNTKDIYNGYQFVITANPLSSLEGRKVFIGDTPATSTFDSKMGLIVTVPDSDKLKVGKWELRIEDPDCLDVYVIDDFQVREDGYFDNLQTFSPPIPPQIVLPTIPITFPASVDNAWLSPEDPGYCLWFIMYKEKKVVNGDTILVPTKLINPDSSFEQATCGCLRDFNTSNLPFAMNRMGGRIEYDPATKTSLIDVFIDRTPIGGDVEEFTGEFIDIDKTRYAQDRGTFDCKNVCPTPPIGVNPPTTGHLMILTSKKTGKQLAAFQLQL